MGDLLDFCGWAASATKTELEDWLNPRPPSANKAHSAIGRLEAAMRAAHA